MSAGYSATPLPRKLGVKPGDRVALLHAPASFPGVGEHVTVVRQARGQADVIVSFHTARRDLERRMPVVRRLMKPAARLWIAWPEKAARVGTDLTEGVGREIALANALVDNKVAAIDETWSGLQLVIRLRDR